MQKIKRNIPNAITCLNLLCGCLAIVKAFEGDLVWASYLVGIAAVLDFLDGFAARILKAISPIGKDLDSLADMVTFGVVPGIIMFQLLGNFYRAMLAQTLISGGENAPDNILFYDLIRYIAFIIPVFSAIRLAKFNNDTRQTDSFIGLPTPANALFICSLPLILTYQVDLNDIREYTTKLSAFLLPDSSVDQASFFLNKRWGFVLPLLGNIKSLVIITLVMSYLLVAEIPLFSLKFKSFGWKGNEIRIIFLAMALTLLLSFQFIGIPIAMILYLLMSVINNYISRRKPV